MNRIRPRLSGFSFPGVNQAGLALLIFFSGLGSIFADQPTSALPVKFLLVVDSQQSSSKRLDTNLTKALQYAGLSFDRIEMAQLAEYTLERLSYDAVILGAEKASSWFFPKDAREYVERGGVIYVALRTWNAELFEPFGLSVPKGINPPEFKDYLGLASRKPIFQDFQVQLPPNRFGASGFDLSLSPEWEILLEYALPASAPLLMTRPFGKGKIVYWNGDSLPLKEFRGLFLFTLLRALPLSAMSMFNTILFEVDDSPPPSWGAKLDPIARDFSLTDDQFYLNVWYDQIFKLLDETRISIAHYPCFQYSFQASGTFEPKTDRADFFGKALKKFRNRSDEIGLHGFNHLSLSLQEVLSPPWPSIEEMVKGLDCSKILWEKLELSPPLTYVPPNNVIDAVGKKALHQVFPSIRAICRLYLGGNDYQVETFGEAMTGDEFEIDPDVPVFLDIPRLTSGFIADPMMMFSLLNGLMTHGLINHFIHPDDVYDAERNGGRSWESQVMNFQRLLAIMNKAAPKAERLLPKQFVGPMKRYLEDSFTQVRTGSSTIQISSAMNPPGRKYFFLFHAAFPGTPKVEGGEWLGTLESGLSLIKMASPTCRISF